MRLAYISYEHPLGEKGGGIGTYVDQIATIMASRHHDVEVFTRSAASSYASHRFKNYLIHLVPAENATEFRSAVVPIFDSANEQSRFDAMESAEYGADGLLVKLKHDGIPLVVKLHTPHFLVGRLNFKMPSFFKKARFLAGSFLRGQPARPYWKETFGTDDEKTIYDLADTVTSPSLSLAQIVANEWGERAITVLPNPYVPSAARSDTNRRSAGGNCRVLFIGRLEQRKGIYDLLAAIPKVLEQDTSILFDFAGADQPSFKKNISVRALMEERLQPYLQSITFHGYLDSSALTDLFAQTDICVFPSLWENFPNVCLESMAAGLPVIASRNGGMGEIITHGKDGLLISPGSPDGIVAAVLKLARDKRLRAELGSAARQTILERYNAEEIGSATERVFREAIKG